MHESRGKCRPNEYVLGFRGTYQKGQDSFSWVVLVSITFRLPHDGALLGHGKEGTLSACHWV